MDTPLKYPSQTPSRSRSSSYFKLLLVVASFSNKPNLDKILDLQGHWQSRSGRGERSVKPENSIGRGRALARKGKRPRRGPKPPRVCTMPLPRNPRQNHQPAAAAQARVGSKGCNKHRSPQRCETLTIPSQQRAVGPSVRLCDDVQS